MKNVLKAAVAVAVFGGTLGYWSAANAATINITNLERSITGFAEADLTAIGTTDWRIYENTSADGYVYNEKAGADVLTGLTFNASWNPPSQALKHPAFGNFTYTDGVGPASEANKSSGVRMQNNGGANNSISYVLAAGTFGAAGTLDLWLGSTTAGANWGDDQLTITIGSEIQTSHVLYDWTYEGTDVQSRLRVTYSGVLASETMTVKWENLKNNYGQNVEMYASALAAEAASVVVAPFIDSDDPTDITTASATMNGTLTTNGNSAAAVHLFWGPSDGGTNQAAWAHTNYFGVNGLGTPRAYSTNITALSSSTLYSYRYYATNASAGAWALSSKSFINGGVGIQKTSDASEIGLTPGTFTVHRASTATNCNLALTYAWAGGSATSGVDYAALTGSVTIPAGATSAQIVLTPLANWANQSDTTLQLALVSGSPFCLFEPSATAATMTIANEIGHFPTVTITNPEKVAGMLASADLTAYGTTDWKIYANNVGNGYVYNEKAGATVLPSLTVNRTSQGPSGSVSLNYSDGVSPTSETGANSGVGTQAGVGNGAGFTYTLAAGTFGTKGTLELWVGAHGAAYGNWWNRLTVTLGHTVQTYDFNFGGGAEGYNPGARFHVAYLGVLESETLQVTWEQTSSEYENRPSFYASALAAEPFPPIGTAIILR